MYPGSSNSITGNALGDPMHRANPSILENLADKVNSQHKTPNGAKYTIIKEVTISLQIVSHNDVSHNDWFSEDFCRLFGLEGGPQLRPQGQLHDPKAPDPSHLLKQ